MSTFKISMKPKERIYINGAVIQFDRKTSLEFLNDVQFLLESHILQLDQANTPLKRLYFTVQIQLMSPNDTQIAKKKFSEQLMQLLSTFDDHYITNELKNIDRMVKEARFHEAMKALRPLFKAEEEIFSSIKTSFPFDDIEQLEAAVG